MQTLVDKVKTWCVSHPKLSVGLILLALAGGSWFFRKTPPRFYSHSLEDYNQASPSSTSQKVKIPFERLRREFEELLNRLLSEYPPKVAGKHGDVTLYTGTLGLSYLFLHLYDIWSREEEPRKQKFLDYASQYFEMAERHFQNAPSVISDGLITFYGGMPAFYAIGAVLYDRKKNYLKSLEFVDKFVKYANQDSVSADFLWGLTGYLNGCAYLNSHLRPDLISDNIVQNLFDKIIEMGKKEMQLIHSSSWGFIPFKDRKLTTALCSLQFGRSFGTIISWLAHPFLDRLTYVGAGHGLAGALITFTNFPALIKNEDDFRILQNIGDHLLSLQTSEGHFPVLMQPSPRFQFQPFVQFCHGAPGIGLALCRMYQLTKNNKYLEASIRAADVVWNYGLLQKGNGLCHGVAGNAYLFLYLFHVTDDYKHLHRAVKFAEFSWSKEAAQFQRKADNPYSLFEGIAGTIIFYSDLFFRPKDCRFPAVQFF